MSGIPVVKNKKKERKKTSQFILHMAVYCPLTGNMGGYIMCGEYLHMFSCVFIHGNSQLILGNIPLAVSEFIIEAAPCTQTSN